MALHALSWPEMDTWIRYAVPYPDIMCCMMVCTISYVTACAAMSSSVMSCDVILCFVWPAWLPFSALNCCRTGSVVFVVGAKRTSRAINGGPGDVVAVVRGMIGPD
eukprot:3143351-Pyramimonas_sp.AAC.1